MLLFQGMDHNSTLTDDTSDVALYLKRDEFKPLKGNKPSYKIVRDEVVGR